MAITTFLDLPVYRIPENQYYAERENYIEKVLYQGPPELQEQQRKFHRKNPERKSYMVGLFEDIYGGPWIYNEIIGFIGLHFLGQQIRGEYFDTKPKRKVKTRKRQFKYNTWKLASEMNIPPSSSDVEIFEIVLIYVERCRKEIPRRYIDASHLEVLGPRIRWRDLINDQ